MELLDPSCKGGWGSLDGRREGRGSLGKGRRTGWGLYWMGQSVQSHILRRLRRNGSRTHACCSSSIELASN